MSQRRGLPVRSMPPLEELRMQTDTNADRTYIAEVFLSRNFYSNLVNELSQKEGPISPEVPAQEDLNKIEAIMLLPSSYDLLCDKECPSAFIF